MKIIFSALLLFAMTAKAQISYDFENGGIEDWVVSQPGRWGICTATTINGNGSLCHIFDNPSSGHDQLSLLLYPLSVADSTTLWHFKIRHAYDPSSYNNWGFFLFSDQPAGQMYPGGNINGYAVGVNITGSDDLLKIWKFVNGEPEILLTTEVNWQEEIGTSIAAAIDVSRSPSGLWRLSMDAGGSFDQMEEVGTAADNDFTNALYAGLYYKYSSANDRKLSMDDLLIKGYFLRDTINPEILKIFVQDNKHLKILFSEPVVAVEATNRQNYQVDGITQETPDSVLLVNDHTILLSLQTPLPDGERCLLKVQNISDPAGNRITSDPISFTWHKPAAGDIVINEIMADPSPQQGLPECEYLELLNTADYEVNLTNWVLNAGEDSYMFSECILEAGEYLLLTNINAAAMMDVYGSTLPLFTSVYTLSNDGISLVLKNKEGLTVSEVMFDPAWHFPRGKAAGGWSLEKIDPMNNCSGAANWTSSVNESGGTPGRQNSVYASNKDTTAPRILAVSEISDNTVKVLLSEKPINTAFDTEIFLQESGKLYPDTFYMTSDTVSSLAIIFHDDFEQAKEYELSILLPDDCGNMLDTTINFTFYRAQPFDIIISEIMADPEPAVDLPPVEYLELYNRSNYTVHLKGWSLSTTSSSGILPPASLSGGEYAIVCSRDAKAKLLPYGKVICPDKMPVLPNSGQQLILRTDKGKFVSQVEYSVNWYSTEYKSEGGWSLEIIDPDNPCGLAENWQESKSRTGGTPGRQNTVFDTNPDTDNPEPRHVALLNDSTLIVYFSETTDSLSLVATTSCEVHPESGKLTSKVAETPDFRNLILIFDRPFRTGIDYKLTLVSSATDCAGNSVQSSPELPFSVPAKADSMDIIINEVLFNPFPGGSDFVEIYNRSRKTFDLREILLAGFDEETFQYTHPVPLSSRPWLLFPGEFQVFTEDAANVRRFYNCPDENALHELTKIPSLPDKSGRIALLGKEGQVLDDFPYTDDMHFPMLVTTDGVSLERVSYDRPANERSNWHSAAQTVGFATPGYQNSQFLSSTDLTDEITVSPEVFSPDNDGNDDLLNISYKFDQPGFVATITIFDARGRTVCKLLQNELLGSSGSITWDGMEDTGQRAQKGIYLIYIQVFNPAGTIKDYKKTCVLGGYL